MDSHRLWNSDHRLRLQSVQRTSKLCPCCSVHLPSADCPFGIVDAERPPSATTYFKNLLERLSNNDNKQMITSIHTLIYSDDADATRAFFRDVLGWKYVAEEWDNNWLIFKSGPSELGVHPTHSLWEGKTYEHPRQHSIALMCDDIDATVSELRTKGAQFRGPIEDREYGRIIMVIVPGADDIQLYQPTHKLAYNL